MFFLFLTTHLLLMELLIDIITCITSITELIVFKTEFIAVPSSRLQPGKPEETLPSEGSLLLIRFHIFSSNFKSSNISREIATKSSRFYAIPGYFHNFFSVFFKPLRNDTRYN